MSEQPTEDRSDPPASATSADRFDAELPRLARRHTRQRVFKGCCIAAVLFAAAFLLFFVGDLLYRGLPALRQGEIRTNIDFSPAIVNDIDAAFPEEHRDLVSRAAKRSIAREALNAYLRVIPDPEAVTDGGFAPDAVQAITVTEDDMPPWQRRDFEPTTIPAPMVRSLIAAADLDPEPHAEGDGSYWVRGSAAVQQFLTDSSGLAGERLEVAKLLDKADRLTLRFDRERFGDGTVEERWVVLDSTVDQYLKGYDRFDPDNYENPEDVPLALEDQARIDSLREAGTVALHFNTGFFTNGDSKIPEIAGMRGALVGSIYVLALVLVLCLPIGVMTSIYLEEFAPDNKLTQLIEVNINNLAAIPSILFGVLGLAAFITFFGMPRSSVLVGAATLTLMTLPVIIVSSRAALRAVPASIRRAGFAMGATRWQVVLHHVLPASLPGIMTGSIIGIAQAMGETAPLIIIGLVSFVPEAAVAPTDPTTVMPAQIFSWWGMPQPAFQERAALGILVLLGAVVFLNGLAVAIRARTERGW